MQSGNVWELPFEQPAVLELRSEYGTLALQALEPGQQPRLELLPGSADNVEVSVDKRDQVVRVGLDPLPGFRWFGAWECRAVLYVPKDVRAAIQTNAGSVSVRGLEGCELGIKANAGKIDLVDVYGLLHLGADAGSITGRAVGGFFDIETHAGSVRMEILDLQPGEHHIRASMGSVKLELARGMEVCIETHTSLGSVRNSYPVRTEAPTKLVVTTEMGSLRIDEAGVVRAERRVPVSEQPAPKREDPELERILKMVEAGELSA